MKRFVCTTFAVLALALFAHAGVIVNTFGPNYGVGNATWVINSSPHFYESVAAPFTPSTDVTVSQIDVGLYAYTQVSNIEVSLTSDHWGLPGTIIQSWDLQYTGGYQQQLATLFANASLQGGSQYWITVVATDTQTDMGWFFSYYDLQGPVGFDVGSGWGVAPSTDVPAFDVIGASTVPEPGTLGLLGAAALGMAGVIRRRISG
jgi:hypothetical protein